MSRNEHLQWAKTRALEYLTIGDKTGALSSMFSDLRRHAELRDHCGIELGAMLMAGGFLSTDRDIREYIEGFN